MNKKQQFSFRYTKNEIDDEDWNIWDIDLIEGERTNKQVRESSLQENMECNSFWKFDKSYGLRNQRKYSNNSDYSNNEANNLEQIFHIQQELFHDNRDHTRLSLKDEVSILLKALVISKKNRKWSDVSSPFSSNIHTHLRDRDSDLYKVEITMMQIEPFEMIDMP